MVADAVRFWDCLVTPVDHHLAMSETAAGAGQKPCHTKAPPRVSVILPVFNAERYVGIAIDSIVAQTFKDFEVVVVDDGSTDASLSVIRLHAGMDHRFRVISRENRGIVASCNEAICASRGAYLMRMDADDIAHPERFAIQVKYLDEHPECLAVGTRMLLCDEQGLPIVEMISSFTHEQIDAENLRGEGSAICHPSVAMRRDAILALGGYRKEFEWAEDLDLFLRMAEVGKLANLPTVLLTYRQHLRSVGYSRRAQQIDRTALAVQAARTRRASPGEMHHFAIAECSKPAPVVQENESIAAIHRKWAWLALLGGNPSTARKHAFKALALSPLSRHNVRLLACAIRGR